MAKLLYAKLLPPYAGTKLMERPRLLALLSQPGRAALLVAPAGYGKTVSIIQFAQSLNRPLLWYQLDKYDNDPAVFLNYLIAGIRQYHPDFGQELLHLIAQGGLASNLRLMVMLFINELEIMAGNGLLIALDDYYMINETFIHEFVQELLINLPSSIYLVIASRAMPPFSLSRLNIMGKAGVIGPNELRFNRQEISLYWSQSYGKLSAAAIDDLEGKTAGWPVALRLLRNAAPANSNSVIPDHSQDLYDYLAAEIFDCQTATVRSFLLRTSVLEDLTAEFCDLLLERTDSQEILTLLERQQLFLIPLYGNKRTYRFHHLFRAFLQERLGADRKILFHRAGILYRESGELARAIECLFAADARGDLFEVLKTVGSQLFYCGQWQTLSRWLDLLAEDVLAAEPWLAFYKAKVEVCRGRLDEAQAWLYRIDAASNTIEETAGLIEIRLLQARLFRYRDCYRESLDTLELIVNQTGGKSTHQFELSLEKSLCLFMLGRFDEAEVILSDELEVSKKNNDRYGMIHLLEGLGNVYFSQGKYDQALQVYEKAADMTAERILPSYYTQDAISIIYHDRGEWDLAFNYAVRNVEMKEQFGLTASLPSAYVQLAGLYSDKEQWGLAEEYFHRAIALIRSNHGERYALVLNIVFLAECLSLQGRWVEAQAKVEEAMALAEPQGGLALAICRAVGSVIFLQTGKVELGKELLGVAIADYKRMGFKKGLCHVYAFKAWHALTEGNITAAKEDLGQALPIITELKYQQLFLGRYVMLRPLLKLALESGIEVPFVQQILIRLGERGVPYLTDLVNHPDPEVRMRTIAPLLEIGCSHARKAICCLIRDPDPSVRKVARMAEEQFTRLDDPDLLSSPVKLLQIASFGSFQVFWGNGADRIIHWRTKKTRDLLAYLIHQQEPVTKEKIVSNLWNDMDSRSAAAIFHTTVHYLRDTLSKVGCENLIVYSGKRYHVQPGKYRCERQQFQEWLVAGLRTDLAPEKAAVSLEKAVTFYHGDYLEDIDYPWAIPYRETARRSCVEARMWLARYYLDALDYTHAISHLHSIEELDPFAEEAHGLLMSAYAKQGDRMAIQKQYRKLVLLLKRELGVSPSPMLSDLYFKLSQ